MDELRVLFVLNTDDRYKTESIRKTLNLFSVITQWIYHNLFSFVKNRLLLQIYVSADL